MKINEISIDSRERRLLPMMYVRLYILMNIMDYLYGRKWHHEIVDGAIHSYRNE